MRHVVLFCQSSRVSSEAWLRHLGQHHQMVLSEVFLKGKTLTNDYDLIDRHGQLYKTKQTLLENSKISILFKLIAYQVENFEWFRNNCDFICLRRKNLKDIICSRAVAQGNNTFHIWKNQNIKPKKVKVSHYDVSFIVKSTILFEKYIKSIKPIVNVYYKNFNNLNIRPIKYSKKDIVENYDKVDDMILTTCDQYNFDYNAYGYEI